jgi:hypothetical protein
MFFLRLAYHSLPKRATYSRRLRVRFLTIGGDCTSTALNPKPTRAARIFSPRTVSAHHVVQLRYAHAHRNLPHPIMLNADIIPNRINP